MSKYILSIDQSTQGTKGLLFSETGALVARCDLAHKQIVDERGWVEHDPVEILQNTLAVARMVTEKAGIDKTAIQAMGISNQRETALAWNRATGEPIYNAIVWQCARGAAICERLSAQANDIQARSGLPLSPYFSAAKLGWILEQVPAARKLAEENLLCCGTVDSFLIHALTKEHAFKTDYSNASRTQLFNIRTLAWDSLLCEAFGVPSSTLAEVCMSDSCFGHTDLGGWLEKPIPIHGVLGDSHGALFGQNCRTPGKTKATYGTGSSVMMHVGDTPVFSENGLVTSLAWGMNGKVEYVLEGNINYTGAAIRWLRDQVGLIQSDAEIDRLAEHANPADRTYCVPAFTGLGAPHWDSTASALLTGMARTTGRAEIAKAVLESIAYQITDLVEVMRQDAAIPLTELRADGGPTASRYLMQRQSDFANVQVVVPSLQELSGMGAAYAAGIAVKLYDPEQVYEQIQHTTYPPLMDAAQRTDLYTGWQWAIRQARTHP